MYKTDMSITVNIVLMHEFDHIDIETRPTASNFQAKVNQENRSTWLDLVSGVIERVGGGAGGEPPPLHIFRKVPYEPTSEKYNALGPVLPCSYIENGTLPSPLRPLSKTFRAVPVWYQTKILPGSGGLLISMVCMAMMFGPVKHSTYLKI